MNKIFLNGADAEKVANIIGGTLIMLNESNDIAMISGGDLSQLKLTKATKVEK